MCDGLNFQEEIIEALEKVCHLVSGDLQMHCVEFLNGYTAEILETITQKLNPGILCNLIGACHSGNEVTMISTSVVI